MQPHGGAHAGLDARHDVCRHGTGLGAAPPHIPQPVSALLYPASGITGELGYLSIGVGYTLPFQLFAAEWIRADELADRLNALRLPGVVFRPVHFKPFYSTGQGRPMQGVQVHLTDYAAARLTEIQFYVMQEVAALYPDRAVFDHADPSRFRMFDQVCGSDSIRLSLCPPQPRGRHARLVAQGRGRVQGIVKEVLPLSITTI